MSGYAAFLASKTRTHQPLGIAVDGDLHAALKPFQRDLVRWALRKGRAAIFADTGLGKTIMQLVWAREIGRRVLILAPLAVAQQTVTEGARWGITARYVRSQAQCADGISITNYEMLPHFDPAWFDAVVLDESSILKSFEGKTRTTLIEAFRDTPYRLCCTATPAPNDIAEIANHAEFLGVMTRVELLATFFVHDQDGWRLKGHAVEPFYRWLASWGMAVKRPSDLGDDDAGYALPPLHVERLTVETGYVPAGQLFATTLRGIGERTAVRKETVEARVQAAVDLVAAEPDEPWLLWCGLNDEGRQLAARIPGAVLVEGADPPDRKAAALLGFTSGSLRVLITKPSIAGFGMNWQHCARMAFVGLSDSYEQFYQAVRRCWRFGQTRQVRATVILTDLEEPIWTNVQRKSEEAERLSERLMSNVREYEREEIAEARARSPYVTTDYQGHNWRLLQGDAAERLAEIEPRSVDLAVFSPPFSTLYTYSASDRDLGNCATPAEFWTHFRFIIDGLLRVMRPGRNVCVHVAQIPLLKGRDGVIGLSDFRGETIQQFTDAGFVYHGEVCIDKDPQAQAIRTKSKSLLFVQLRKDASWMRPALADYILVFRASGENAVPVQPDITNDEWIEWARPIWYGIRESDTLNVAEARSQQDERHICPLQLGTIERCVRLWSNPGELVLSPFAGIGSEGYQALLSGRRFVGVELKPEYARVAARNLERAERSIARPTLFDVEALA